MWLECRRGSKLTHHARTAVIPASPWLSPGDSFSARPAEFASAPSSRNHRSLFTHDGDVATLPITIVDNRVIVDVTLNGSGPYKFILDSGAGRGAVLDAALFAHLGLTSNAESQESGAGEKTQRALHGTLASLAIGLGDLRFSKLPIRAVDLAPLAGVIGFPQLDGVLGDDLFRRYVVHVDSRIARSFESNQRATFAFRRERSRCRFVSTRISSRSPRAAWTASLAISRSILAVVQL